MRNLAKREMVSACMESPIYFTVPLRHRLELVNRQVSGRQTRHDFLTWVKTGYYNLTRLMARD
jgi:hypothetical protein